MSGPDSKEPGRFSFISTKSQGDVFEGHFFIIPAFEKSFGYEIKALCSMFYDSLHCNYNNYRLNSL